MGNIESIVIFIFQGLMITFFSCLMGGLLGFLLTKNIPSRFFKKFQQKILNYAILTQVLGLSMLSSCFDIIQIVCIVWK